MRFAVITDLHIGGSVYEEQIKKVVDLTNTLNVDAIFLVGDTIDAPRSWIEGRTVELKNLHSKYGTFLVTGNHESYYGNYEEWRDLFTHGYNINVLENKYVSI
jgi:predicted MPP superfamily phosphohydrolase